MVVVVVVVLLLLSGCSVEERRADGRRLDGEKERKWKGWRCRQKKGKALVLWCSGQRASRERRQLDKVQLTFYGGDLSSLYFLFERPDESMWKDDPW